MEVAVDAPASSSAAASTSVVPAVEDSSDAAAGRKRRAAAGSTPSPSVSPKLAAAVRHGLQCKVQPSEQLGDEGAPEGDDHVQGPGSQAEGAAPSRHTGDAAASTDDDSVPLVGSKLAARVSQERGTPLPAGRGHDAGEPCSSSCRPVSFAPTEACGIIEDVCYHGSMGACLATALSVGHVHKSGWIAWQKLC